MTASNPTWAVVATVDEPPAVVQAFVAWHLSMGASHVSIYCDRPDDPLVDILRDLPKVTVIASDNAHWLTLGSSRPRRHEVRQVRNARHAYAATDADWLIHMDADEFIWSDAPISEHLASLAETVDAWGLPVAERVHLADDPGLSIFEGAFRRPYHGSNKQGRETFGRGYYLTYKGLTGHAQGKTFARANRALSLSIHRAKSEVEGYDVIHERAPCDAVELLHFDGLTAFQWSFKLARLAFALERADGMLPPVHRARQLKSLYDDRERAPALYERLKSVDDAMQDVMRAHDVWSQPPFDPGPALAALFPDAKIDLSPTAIDAWLRSNKKHVLSYLKN